MTPLPGEDDEWFVTWTTALRTPVLVFDDPHVWRMLAAVWLGETVEFLYWGGSTPGARRRMTPSRVFTVESLPALYVEGVCVLRGELRAFRLDRIEWTVATETTNSPASPPPGTLSPN